MATETVFRNSHNEVVSVFINAAGNLAIKQDEEQVIVIDREDITDFINELEWIKDNVQKEELDQ